VETSFRSLIDKLKPKAEDWESRDPAVRAEAVLRLGSDERDLLLSFARDEDARVRRAVAKKVHDVAVLVELARTDADAGVREEAAEALLSLALHAKDAAPALAGLSLPRHLAAVVKSAADPAARRAALERLTEARALAAVARESSDADLRRLAVERLADPVLLAALAQNSEHKAVALAAVERLSDPAALQAVAARSKVGAAARRARARLGEAGAEAPTPDVAAAPPPPADDAERAAYDEQLAALRAAQEQRDRAIAEREALCDRLESAADAAAEDAAAEARAAWEGLSPLAGSEAAALQARFEAAAEGCRARHEAWTAGVERHGRIAALCVEAEALAASEDLGGARSGLAALQKRWAETVQGTTAPPELLARLDAAVSLVADRAQTARTEREKSEKDNLARIEGLAGRLSKLLEGGSLRDVDRALREAKEALDHPGPLPAGRARETALGRLESARKALYPRLHELRADTEWKRWANESVQEQLCARIEALAAEPNLEKAAQELRDLDARWKAAAEVDREKGAELWTRFKAARDPVKAKVDAHFEKKAAEQAESLRAKEALCVRAEALQDSTDWLKTADELKKLQNEWKAAGPLPPQKSKAVWERFRKACDRFFTRREEDLKQRKEGWAENEARKVALCERVEALADSTEWDAASAEIKKLQAEWKTVGPVKKSRSDALWQRFRSAADRFFDRHKRRDEIARSQASEECAAACEAVEALVASSEVPDDLAAQVSAAQLRLRQGGAARELGDRFRTAVAALVAKSPASFQGTDLDPQATRKKMEKLCARVEALAPAVPAAQMSLAEQLKNALAANTMGAKGEAAARQKARADDVQAAREAWDRLSPLPGAEGDALRARFQAAADRALRG
jgi:hypothetical protein